MNRDFQPCELDEDLADFHTERIGREWLLEEGATGIEDSMANDGVVAIAGDVENPHSRAGKGNTRYKFMRAHLGHHDVGHQKVDRSPVPAAEAERDHPFASYLSRLNPGRRLYRAETRLRT